MCENTPKKLIEIVPYFSFIFFLLIFFIFQDWSRKKSFRTLLDDAFNGPQQQIFFSGLKMFVILVLFSFLFLGIDFFIRIISQQHTAERVLQSIKTVPKKIYTFLKIFITSFWIIILNLILVSLVIPLINVWSMGRLWDEVILRIDTLLTGGYPFITLGNLFYPHWLMEIITFSYFQTGTALVVFAMILIIKNKKIYHEFVSSFFISFVILTTLWFIFPTVSPVVRFIKNPFNLPISPIMAGVLENYSPGTQIQTVHAEWDIVSATAFPSAHIVWLSLMFIYLLRFSMRGFFITLPFILLSASGTVILAVHYFADVPAGILVAMLSIFITDKIKMEKMPKMLKWFS